jgi:hypothetical protein
MPRWLPGPCRGTVGRGLYARVPPEAGAPMKRPEDVLEPAESVRAALLSILLHNERVYGRVPPKERRRAIRSKVLVALADLERLLENVAPVPRDS